MGSPESLAMASGTPPLCCGWSWRPATGIQSGNRLQVSVRCAGGDNLSEACSIRAQAQTCFPCVCRLPLNSCAGVARAAILFERRTRALTTGVLQLARFLACRGVHMQTAAAACALTSPQARIHEAAMLVVTAGPGSGREICACRAEGPSVSQTQEARTEAIGAAQMLKQGSSGVNRTHRLANQNHADVISGCVVLEGILNLLGSRLCMAVTTGERGTRRQAGLRIKSIAIGTEAA